MFIIKYAAGACLAHDEIAFTGDIMGTKKADGERVGEWFWE